MERSDERKSDGKVASIVGSVAGRRARGGYRASENAAVQQIVGILRRPDFAREAKPLGAPRPRHGAQGEPAMPLGALPLARQSFAIGANGEIGEIGANDPNDPNDPNGASRANGAYTQPLAVFDMEAALAQVDGDVAFLSELLKESWQQIRCHAERLGEAVAEVGTLGDGASLRKVAEEANLIMGLAKTFSFQRLAEGASQVMYWANEGMQSCFTLRLLAIASMDFEASSAAREGARRRDEVHGKGPDTGAPSSPSSEGARGRATSPRTQQRRLTDEAKKKAFRAQKRGSVVQNTLCALLDREYEGVMAEMRRARLAIENYGFSVRETEVPAAVVAATTTYHLARGGFNGSADGSR